MSQEVIGILVGGGPSPGLNSCIASVTIQAVERGCRVIGFFEGFKYLMKSKFSELERKPYRELTIKDVTGIHVSGGCILRLSRANPTSTEESLQTTIENLLYLNVRKLVIIGGDDTAYAAMILSKNSKNQIAVCCIPKTINNYLPLPSGISTFGYETSRELGSIIVRNLMEDAKTSIRYFVVTVLGRISGWLAMGIGKSASAHLTIIPEEFESEKVSFKHICDIIEGCIIKRKAMNKDHGVIILQEGIIEKLDVEELKALFGNKLSYDQYKHINLDDLDLGVVIRDEMRKRIPDVAFTEKQLGYELRSCQPNAHDLDMAKDLGYAAVQFLLNGGTNCLISSLGGQTEPVPFDQLLSETEANRFKLRYVNTKGEGYEVAQSYMIRLTRKDFEDEKMLQELTKASGLKSVEEFRQKFEYLVSKN